jgi:hypothetical protein
VLSLSVDSPAAGAARLVLAGHLDDEGAREVLHAAADVVRCGCARLVVDLDGITSYDDDAAFAVLGCWRLARFLPDGVALVAEHEIGRALADDAGVPAQGIMGSCRAC